MYYVNFIALQNFVLMHLRDTRFCLRRSSCRLLLLGDGVTGAEQTTERGRGVASEEGRRAAEERGRESGGRGREKGREGGGGGVGRREDEGEEAHAK